jgi:thiamine pyrophosphate-dependent acetolactate synthase large subunit-like protein
MDVWGRSGTVILDGPPRTPEKPPVDDDQVSAAARLLAASRRPLIVVGGGALGASREVIALAERLEAPVVAYRRGQGVMPATHRLHVSLPVAHRLWADADVALGIGTRLFMQQSQWGVDARLKIVRIDIDPEEPHRFRGADAAIVADAQEGCAALGAKTAKPDCPVLAITGDGGFLYQVGELATAVQHNIAVIVVVFDNRSFGNVRLIQEINFGGRIIAADLVNPDFVKLAESFGAAAMRADTPEQLGTAITRALPLNRPVLIHVPCGPMPSPWGMIHMPRVRD